MKYAEEFISWDMFQNSKKTYSAWLIEKGSPAQFFSKKHTSNNNVETFWADTTEWAIQYKTKKDAEDRLKSLNEAAKAVEHLFNCGPYKE